MNNADRPLSKDEEVLQLLLRRGRTFSSRRAVPSTRDSTKMVNILSESERYVLNPTFRAPAEELKKPSDSSTTTTTATTTTGHTKKSTHRAPHEDLPSPISSPRGLGTIPYWTQKPLPIRSPSRSPSNPPLKKKTSSNLDTTYTNRSPSRSPLPSPRRPSSPFTGYKCSDLDYYANRALSKSPTPPIHRGVSNSQDVQENVSEDSIRVTTPKESKSFLPPPLPSSSFTDVSSTNCFDSRSYSDKSDDDSGERRRRSNLPYKIITKPSKAKNGINLVALYPNKKKAVGSLGAILPEDEDTQFAELKSLVVNKEFRGRGIAKEMTKCFMDTIFPEPLKLYFDPGESLGNMIEEPSRNMVTTAAIVYIKSALESGYNRLYVVPRECTEKMTRDLSGCQKVELLWSSQVIKIASMYSWNWRRHTFLFKFEIDEGDD